MKQIYRSVLLFLFATTVLSVHAQDLAHKIPADALAVASVKGNNLLELLSINEFNNSFLGKKILKKTSRETGSEYKDIQAFGINPESSFYYYNQVNDSVSYNCLLIPLKNALKFDKLFSKDGNNKFSMEGNTRSYYNADSTEIMMWNEQMLFITKAGAQYGYFEREAVAKRFAFETAPVDTVSTENYNYEPKAEANEDYPVHIKPAKKSQKSKSAKSKHGKYIKTVKKHSKSVKPVVITDPMEETVGTMEPDTANAAVYMDKSTDEERPDGRRLWPKTCSLNPLQVLCWIIHLI
jgi:hypothetical protein